MSRKPCSNCPAAHMFDLDGHSIMRSAELERRVAELEEKLRKAVKLARHFQSQVVAEEQARGIVH